MSEQETATTQETQARKPRIKINKTIRVMGVHESSRHGYVVKLETILGSDSVLGKIPDANIIDFQEKKPKEPYVTLDKTDNDTTVLAVTITHIPTYFEAVHLARLYTDSLKEFLSLG